MTFEPSHLLAIGGTFLIIAITGAVAARTIVDHWSEIVAALRGDPMP